MKKHVIALTMAAVMAMGALAGCGGQSSTAGTTAAETTAAASEETKEGTEAADESSAEADTDSEETDGADSVSAGEKGTIAVTYVKSPLNVPSIVEKDQEIFAKTFGEMGYDVTYSDLTVDDT